MPLLTAQQLHRLDRLIEMPIDVVRRMASADELKPEAVIGKWTKGQCIRVIIEEGWL